ncbi:MAG: DUF3800 domain-containing protein [Christensenellaceae bacterium]
MERVYAFTDESGAFGWQLDNPSVSTHFIIGAIIVRGSDLESVRGQVEEVRKRYFQTGEMKSSSIGKNHARRKRILADLLKIDFSVFAVVIDKSQLVDAKGLKYKGSFYKWTNNVVHKELKHAFRQVTIVADEIGGSDYMQSFSKYVKERQDIPNLLNDADFRFENSRNNVLIQLSDLISGSLAFDFDFHRGDTKQNYRKMLEKKLARIELYPKTIETYTVDTSAMAENYDLEIADICLRQALIFIGLYEDSDDFERKAQIIILKYLLFRFMNNDQRKYISTKELKGQLRYALDQDLSTQTFRTKVIGKMRDEGVVIASSSPKKGYKIPATKAELYDFINHGTTIILPMLERLKKCRDIVKLGTNNEIDLFARTEYSNLKKYFDDIDE